MKKEKNKSKFKNPLSGIPTKSLLITLFALLLTFAIGFGTGFGCSAHAESQGSATVTAYAAEIAESTIVLSFSNPYSGTRKVPLTFHAIAPVTELLNYVSAPDSYVSPVGTNFAFGSFKFTDDKLSQALVYNGGLLVFQFPTVLTDVGSVPLSAYNRSYFISYYTLDTSNNFVQRFSHSVPLHSNGLFSFSVGNVGFNLGQDDIYSSWGYGLDILPTGSIKTLSVLNSTVSSLGNPSYVLPLYSSLESYDFVTLPVDNSGGNVSLTGSHIYSVCRFYFGAFNGTDLPDVYCDIVFNYYDDAGADPSFTCSLFGTQYSHVLSYVSSDAILSSYNDGYRVGRSDGFDAGLAEGRSEKLEDITPWQHIVNGVNSFLNLQLFPGVHISLILSLAFGMILLGFLLKFFLGG